MYNWWNNLFIARTTWFQVLSLHGTSLVALGCHFSDILTNNCKEGLDEIDWFCWS